MAKIATRIAQLTGEGALAVYTRAKELEKQGRSIIHLELGEPDFHPAAPVVDALRAAVAEGRDRYVSTRGIPPLREGIADYLKRTRKLDVRAEQVLVAPGCKMALALGMMALIEPGDEVLYPDPSFPIYPSFTRGLGAKAVPYALREKNRFQPDVAEIAAKITPKTRMLIFNSPNNPTGTVFSDATLLQIAELARKHDLWVIADEIYARILFSGEYKSIWSLPGMADRTVIIDGFSKSFAMTGWRLGYAVAQTPVIDALDMLVLNTFTCTAEFTQVAGIEALLDITSAVPAMVHEYRKRRDLFVAKLNKIPGFRCQSPDGAFYAWVNIEEVQKILLEEVGVAGIAGAAFGAEGKNFLRFSLVSASHLLEEALERIRRVSSHWRATVAL
jgi:aspartate aminotransferase